VDAAIKDGMSGIAITDNGNMFGVMEFLYAFEEVQVVIPNI
jgi:DNA polymerase III alpha subunit